jgi:hypothetical protein
LQALDVAAGLLEHLGRRRLHIRIGRPVS